MFTLLIKVSEEEKDLISNYARQNNVSISKIMKDAILEKIEDEFDLRVGMEALKEFEKDPTTYTIEEVAQEMGIKF